MHLCKKTCGVEELVPRQAHNLVVCRFESCLRPKAFLGHKAFFLRKKLQGPYGLSKPLWARKPFRVEAFISTNLCRHKPFLFVQSHIFDCTYTCVLSGRRVLRYAEHTLLGPQGLFRLQSPKGPPFEAQALASIGSYEHTWKH